MTNLGLMKNQANWPQTAALRTMDSSKDFSRLDSSIEIPFMEVSGNIKGINFLSEHECRSIEQAVANEYQRGTKSRSRSRSKPNLNGMMNKN